MTMRTTALLLCKCAHLKQTKCSAHASNVPQVCVKKIDHTFIAALCVCMCICREYVCVQQWEEWTGLGSGPSLDPVQTQSGPSLDPVRTQSGPGLD